jgi:hypothetical protein
LETVDPQAFEGTPISRIDASECEALETFAIGWSAICFTMNLPSRFAGRLFIFGTKYIERATFGMVKLVQWFIKGPIEFAEVRFTALAGPRSDFRPEMVADAFVYSETAQLCEREATAARPP